MTPEQLRKLAEESSKAEYEAIMTQMQQAAKEGSHSYTFINISDGAIKQLEDEGFMVNKTVVAKSAIGPTKWGYKVSFKEKA